jgi:hypothetical protein
MMMFPSEHLTMFDSRKKKGKSNASLLEHVGIFIKDASVIFYNKTAICEGTAIFMES